MVVSRFAAVIFVLFCGSGIATGAEESTPVFSGPQSGEKLPALKVTLVYGEGAGQTVDFLGSMSIGNEKQANDSYINLRAAFPAISVYRYNRNPVIGKLLVEWADAWRNDAMRTDRKKPLGVFPAEVGFPGGELGGVNSPNWYTAAHPPGTVNYDWRPGRYYGYLVDLMLLAHEITGEDKYLAFPSAETACGPVPGQS